MSRRITPKNSARKDFTLQVRCNERFLALLDDWRRKQPDLPGRAEAIRRLVEERLRGQQS